METTYRVLRIDEQLYGCEELPAGQPVGSGAPCPTRTKSSPALASTRAAWSS